MSKPEPKNTEQEKYMTIHEVAEKYGVAVPKVRYAIKVGKIQAIKVGWVYLVKKDSLPRTWPGRGVS